MVWKKENGKRKRKKKKKRSSALGIRMWSPTILLTQPTDAQLPSSDGIGCFHLGMTEDKRFCGGCPSVNQKSCSSEVLSIISKGWMTTIDFVALFY